MRKLYMFFCIGLALCKVGYSQDINFEFRDTSGYIGNFIDIPVYTTSSFTGKEVISYSLQYSFSSSVLSPQGVVTTGTISDQFGAPLVNNNVAGKITVAGAGSTPLTGSGIFIFLRFKILGAGGTSISNTGNAANYFNEGDPVLTYINACSVNALQPPNISVSPFSGLIVRGETEQFTASGGSDPYTWEVTDASASSISNTGLLTATGVGITKVKATDAHGNTGFSGNIDIRGYRLSIPDTTGPFNTHIKIPVTTTDLSGLNIISGTVQLSYDSSSLSEIQIETANALLQSFDPPIVKVANQNIKVSFAGSTPLVDSGVLFWIKGKLSKVSGGYSSLTFQDVIFNEELLAITKNGSVSYASPNISINPSSGQLVYGDSLLLGVTGTGITPPLTWSVSNPSLASISPGGYLKVKQSGQVTVSVTDNNGATSTSGVFQLFDTYVKITDTSAIAGKVIEFPVSIKSLPAGQGVLALEGKIQVSDTSNFLLTDIINAGTPTSSFATSFSKGPGYIRFSMAGVTPVPGNSVLFKLKGTIKGSAVEGASASVTLQDLQLNEGIPLPVIQNGTVTVSKLYTFIGSGSWFDPANWLNNQIPPSLANGTDEIVINPPTDEECVLDVEQHPVTIYKLTVMPGKRLRIVGDLIVTN